MRLHRLAFVVLSLLLSQCGSPQSQQSDVKVVGGKPAREYKFMAAVGGEDGEQFCGGSFIRSDLVVTAAHCVYQDREKMWVGAGVQRLSDLNENNRIPVEAIKIHPNYDPRSLHNDVALLFLDRKFIASHGITVEPILLQSTARLPESTVLSAVGWGNATSEGRYREDHLLEAELPLIGNDRCRRSGGDYASVRGDQLCAGHLSEGGVDTCYGDSGGPLFLRQGNAHRLVGIVSWGEGCAEPGKPGVYTRVSAFSDWIIQERAHYDHIGDEVEAHEIGNLVRMFCYQGLDVREKAQGDGVWYDAYRQFTAGDDFELAERDEENLAGLYCEFELPSGRTFSVFAADVKTANPMFVVKSMGAVWKAPAKGDLDFLMSCNKENSLSRIHFSQQDGYGSFLGSGQNFEFETVPTTADLSSSTELLTCQMQRTSYRYMMGMIGGEKRNFVEIESPLLSTRQVFELFPIQPENETRQTSPVNIQLMLENETSGRLAIKNISPKKIFGWQLSCNFQFSLNALSGEPVPVNHMGDLYQVQFSAADKRLGILPAQSSLEFQLESADSIDPADPLKKCTLNGFAVRLDGGDSEGQKG